MLLRTAALSTGTGAVIGAGLISSVDGLGLLQVCYPIYRKLILPIQYQTTAGAIGCVIC
jgi:hypothetical protein